MASIFWFCPMSERIWLSRSLGCWPKEPVLGSCPTDADGTACSIHVPQFWQRSVPTGLLCSQIRHLGMAYFLVFRLLSSLPFPLDVARDQGMGQQLLHRI